MHTPALGERLVKHQHRTTRHWPLDVYAHGRMLRGARQLDVTIKDADCSAHLERLAAIDEKTFERLDDATAAALKSIWADPDIAALYLRRSEYYLPDSTGYFYNDMDRISAPGLPANQLLSPTYSYLLPWRISETPSKLGPQCEALQTIVTVCLHRIQRDGTRHTSCT